MGRKEWHILSTDKNKALEIAEKFDIDPFVALLLTGRGITDEEQIRGFFSTESPGLDPFSFKDMDKAARRIEEAVEKGEKIAIYGDYDADGVTAAAILYSYLSAREADVIYYIPERETDGYGLNMNAVDKLKDEGINLVITVDNGITANKEAEYLKSLHIDLVITDHHRMGDALPDAYAVVDPYRPDCTCGFKGLSGAGIALKLVAALEGCVYNDVVEEYVDLAAIGILADVSPMYDENRLIVRQGLKSINKSCRIGLLSLIEASGMKGKEITATNILFSIIPRINAAGRIGSAARMIRLFLTDSIDEAEEIAHQIDDENKIRKAVEEKIILDIENYITQNQKALYDRVLIFKGKGWHQGVLGISAARISEKYGKPCIILNEEEGELCGSGRSISGFSIFDAIASCEKLTSRFGGHTLAAGVSIPVENYESFKESVNHYAKVHFPQMPFQKVNIDCKLPPKSLTCDLADSLSALEPFGVKNPVPMFGLFGYRIESIFPLSDGKHIRINLWRDNTMVSAVKFNTPAEKFPYQPGDVIDAAVLLGLSYYRGEDQLSVIVKEIRFSKPDEEKLLSEIRLFEAYRRGEEIAENKSKEIIPTRDEIAEIYCYLKKLSVIKTDVEVLYLRFKRKHISFVKFRIAIDALHEMNIIQLNEDGQDIEIIVNKNPEKVNILDAKCLQLPA